MEDTKNREMHIVRTFKAPIELMWEVWTDPEHIVNWWGPNGFTNTMDTMDVREGGEWKFTMHGPDGTDYANRSVYKEVIPLKKIVFEHFNPHFITTVLFKAMGDETRVDWTMLFDTAELRDIIIKTHKADDGLKQNLDKLEAYFAKLKNI